MSTAKIFWSGNSQAVRLPKSLRFPSGVTEIDVHRDGESLVFEPRQPKTFGDDFLAVLGSLPDFRRPRQTRTKRKRIFP